MKAENRESLMTRWPLWLSIFGTLILCLGKSASASQKCSIRSPQADVVKRLAGEERSDFLQEKVHLNGDSYEDLIVIVRDSCGSKGCLNFIYLSTGKDCFAYGGEFFGFLTLEDRANTSKAKVLKFRANGKAQNLILNTKSNTYEVSR